MTIRTGSGGWRGYARQRVAQASLCRAGRFLGTSLLPATIFLSPQIFLPISLDNRFDLMAYLISFIYIYIVILINNNCFTSLYYYCILSIDFINFINKNSFYRKSVSLITISLSSFPRV